MHAHSAPPAVSRYVWNSEVWKAIRKGQEKEGEDADVSIHPLVDLVLSGGGQGWHGSQGLVVEPIPEMMVGSNGLHFHPPH